MADIRSEKKKTPGISFFLIPYKTKFPSNVEDMIKRMLNKTLFTKFAPFS
jgi:hypothetical protein